MCPANHFSHHRNPARAPLTTWRRGESLRGVQLALATGGARGWILGLGGPGLILVGLIDNSVVPIPGGMDVCTILLTANHREWWLYYAAMATAGAVLGGYLTYRLSKKGGKAGLEKKIGPQRAAKVYKKVEKGGFSTVLVASLLPPPFPLVPVLMAAGVLQYSRRRFLSALALGRGARFVIVALMG